MGRGIQLGPGRVAVVTAMWPELRPIVDRFALERDVFADPLFRGRAGSRELVAAVTSMGTAAATRVTGELLDAGDVAHLIVVGIAGAIDPRLAIGELLNPEEVFSEATGALKPIPLIDAADSAPRGRLLTQDALINTPEARDELHRRGFIAVDMETAAIGAVAESRGIPWSVARAISDVAGDPELDAGILGLTTPDGTAKPIAVARYLFTRPWRIPQLARLGVGMRKAVASSTQSAILAIQEIQELGASD